MSQDQWPEDNFTGFRLKYKNSYQQEILELKKEKNIKINAPLDPWIRKEISEGEEKGSGKPGIEK